jgi:hypothetical protein
MPEWWRPYFETFVSRAHELVRATGAQPTSFIRSTYDNQRVGGASNSQHLVGTGLDLVPRMGSSNSIVAARARSLGLVAIDEGDHVHVQLFQANTLPAWVFQALAS